MDEVPSIDKKIASNSHHQNGTIQHRTHKESVPSNEPIINHTNPRLSSPGDDSSRMSFSSTSSKESSSFINHTNEINGITSHSSLSESVSTPISDIPIKPFETTFTPINGHTTRNSNIRTTNGLPQTVQLESQPAAISKIERDQEIQKFYRAELIQHLTDWPSTQLEKQCLKLFDDYYGYSAKISTAFTELKALKSNFRVVHIKRNVLTQKLIRCQKHAREREEDKPL